MNIKPESVSISKQVLTAKQQQSYLLEKLNYLESQVKEDFDFIRGMIAFAAQTFIVKCEKYPASNVDRMSNMLSGPLFTSFEYPIPNNGRQMLFPVLQLDLRDISALGNKEIGDGLLQLWCDTLSLDCIIRVIPRIQVLQEKMVPFDFKKPELCYGGGEFNGFPLPLWFNLDPLGDSVDVMESCIPGRFESQLEGYCGDYGNNINGLIDKDMRKDLAKFGKISVEKTFENLTFFGTYPVIQYNSSDTNSFCLLSISDWGSSGSTEIFYKLNPNGETEYKIFSSLR